MSARAASLLVTLGALAFCASAHAQAVRRPQPRAAPPPLASAADDPSDFRARFGVERAAQLLRSTDEADRLRGVERAAALGTPAAVALLIQQLDPASPTRADPRAKIAIARGLAPHVDESTVRSALVVLAGIPSPRPSSQKSETEDPDYAARLDVARRTAALALARSGDGRAVEALAAIARGTGAGATAARSALAALPPSGATAAWARPLSAETVRLVVRTGDRRALESVLDAAKTGDAETRAAAIDALGALGDARVIEIARASAKDDDPGVRASSAAALVALGAPDAAGAVEQLLANDATAARGVELATAAHGAGIVRALTARAAASADLDVRSAAVAALGRDPGADGIEALSVLVKDPALRAGAADAIARSPSASAMGAIARLAADPATRRQAVRAYVVRSLVRGETDDALGRAAGDLARSPDARDRAVGVFAGVALGSAELARSLEDRDPQVRRAAAMASFARRTSATRAALLSRRAREDDATTRAVLSAGLAGDDGAGAGPGSTGAGSTRDLLSCARAGGPDAPMCALAFARGASPAEAGAVDALLSSRDPILRAHAARGLASSADPTCAGRLAAAYAYEPDALARRAIVVGLGAVARAAPSIGETLGLAAGLDPDPEVRWTAARILAGRPPAASDASEVAWVRLIDGSGAPPPPGATGALLGADGLAVPIAFDADGDALVPGVPAGTARLILAPRLGAAYAPSP